MKQKVLCIAPYSNYHPLHGMWEMTLLHALRLRGAEVEYYLCDGLSACCDLFRLDPAQKDCRDCMHRSAELARSMGMPVRWLGSLLTEDDARRAHDFATEQPVESLLDAVAGNWAIGKWIRSSLYTYFREADLDLRDPAVVGCCRSYLRAGLLYAIACDRVMERFSPTVQLLFNARMAFVKVAAEVGAQHGVPYYSHERGWLPERFSINRDDVPMSPEYFEEMWRLWGDVPLVREELQAISEVLRNRERGKNLNWTAYSPPPGQVESLRAQLGIAAQARIWGLFTSSEDEVVSLSRYRPGAFANQPEWIVRTLAFMRVHPDVHLVIRVHPNTGGSKSTGISRKTLRFFDTLRPRLPANVTLVAPDDPVSTYDIMAAAETGLVFLSTCGLEMACRGKPAVCAAPSYYAASGVAAVPGTVQAYDELLHDLAAAPQPRSVDAMRRAHRFLYASFYRADVPFPLVSMPTPYTGRLAYTTLEELAEGRDANLDTLCRMILRGEPVLPAPGPAEAARTEVDEQEWFAAALARQDNTQTVENAS